jgi:hypothetical protein
MRKRKTMMEKRKTGKNTPKMMKQVHPRAAVLMWLRT